MRWLVGWSSVAASFGTVGAVGTAGATPSSGSPGSPGSSAFSDHESLTVHPVGAQLLWGDPDPLWAVGDWRPDEVRTLSVDAFTRIAVLGCCGASDEELRVGLFAARGGALRHLTAWSGSYTAVVQVGRRVTVAGDLAGARPVFYTPWANGTAYATAALPLADLIEAQLDIGHLAALLACPDVPEALRDGTPYAGVRRIPPGHALVLREGSREITGYEPVASLAVAAPQLDPERAVDDVRDALVEAVRARLTAPRPRPRDPAARPGSGPRHGPRRAPGRPRRARPRHRCRPLRRQRLRHPRPAGRGPAGAARHGPGPRHGRGGSGCSPSFNDLTAEDRGNKAELERAGAIAANPRLHHVVVAVGGEALPYADLGSGPLTDEPGPSLVTAERHRRRLAAGSADHFTGHGARQVLDAHPARLADLLMDRRRRDMLRPVTALAKVEGPSAHSLFVPLTVYRAARRLARTPYRAGIEETAGRLMERRFDEPGARGGGQRRRGAARWRPHWPPSPGAGRGRPHAG